MCNNINGSVRTGGRDRQRKLVRDKSKGEVIESTLRTISAAQRLKWRRADRSYRLGRAKVRKARKLTAALAALRSKTGFEPDADVFADVRAGMRAWRELSQRFIAEKSPLAASVLRSGLVESGTQRASVHIQEAVESLLKRHFRRAISWYEMGKRVVDLKCPWCGTHTIFRLCSRQNLRLCLISFRHARDVLESCDSSDSVAIAAVVGSFYGWRTFGVGGPAEVESDLRRIFGFLQLSPLRAAGLLRVTVKLIKRLRGLWQAGVTAGFLSQPPDSRVEQSQLWGMSPPEVVWSMWAAVVRLLLGFRGAVLRFAYPEDALELIKLVISIQRRYFSLVGQPWMIQHVEEAGSSFIRLAGQFALPSALWTGVVPYSALQLEWQRAEDARVAQIAQAEAVARFVKRGPKPIYRDAVIKPRFSLQVPVRPEGPSSLYGNRPPADVLVPFDPVPALTMGQTKRNPGFLLHSLPPAGRMTSRRRDFQEGIWPSQAEESAEVLMSQASDTNAIASTSSAAPDPFLGFDETKVFSAATAQAVLHEEAVVTSLNEEQEALQRAAEDECKQQ